MTDQPKRSRWKRRALDWQAWVESCVAGLTAFISASVPHYLTETQLIPLSVSAIIGATAAVWVLCLHVFSSEQPRKP